MSDNTQAYAATKHTCYLHVLWYVDTHLTRYSYIQYTYIYKSYHKHNATIYIHVSAIIPL